MTSVDELFKVLHPIAPSIILIARQKPFLPTGNKRKFEASKDPSMRTQCFRFQKKTKKGHQAKFTKLQRSTRMETPGSSLRQLRKKPVLKTRRLVQNYPLILTQMKKYRMMKRADSLEVA